MLLTMESFLTISTISSSIVILAFFFIGIPIIKWRLRKFIKDVLFEEYCATAEAKRKRESLSKNV